MQCVFPVKPILVHGPLPSHRFLIWSVLLQMLRAGWSCPTQTGYQAGSEEAPWDGNCSQTRYHAVAVSWYNFAAEGLVVPLDADSAQVIPNPKDVVCTTGLVSCYACTSKPALPDC